MSDLTYRDRPEWSYSDMKVILEYDIDYAVAVKRKLLEKSYGKVVDIGTLAHEELLKQGGSNSFVVKAYKDFRTNEAKDWRDAQTVPIISDNEFEQINKICETVRNHPLYSVLLCGEGIENEVELYAKINGVAIKGKADAIRKNEDGSIVICDLKTTAKFEDWKMNEPRDMWKIANKHYDLQCANYTQLGLNPNLTNFYFFVAETVEPYRVKVMHCALAFVESGEQKLAKCIEQIKQFGDRNIDFTYTKTLNEVEEIGDFSL